jgi:hypothetical protein
VRRKIVDQDNILALEWSGRGAARHRPRTSLQSLSRQLSAMLSCHADAEQPRR